MLNNMSAVSVNTVNSMLGVMSSMKKYYAIFTLEFSPRDDDSWDRYVLNKVNSYYNSEQEAIDDLSSSDIQKKIGYNTAVIFPVYEKD